MDNPETLATLGTPHTGQTKHKITYSQDALDTIIRKYTQTIKNK